MVQRVVFTVERRFCSHYSDGESVPLYVDTGKADWYKALILAIKCKKITTVSGKEIKDFSDDLLNHNHFIAEGWPPGFARELVLPMVYEADYFENFEIWFNQLEHNICSSIVNYIMHLDKPSKFRKMMNHEMYRELVRKYKKQRKQLHYEVFNVIKKTIEDDYYKNNFKVNEYDIVYLNENADRIVHEILGYVKAYLYCCRMDYSQIYDCLKQDNESYDGFDRALLDYLNKVVQSALLGIWGDYKNRGHEWIHNTKCFVPNHTSGLYDCNKNWVVKEDRFAIYGGMFTVVAEQK